MVKSKPTAFTKLAAWRMSQQMTLDEIKDGEALGVIEIFKNPDRLKRYGEEARQFAKDAVALVRTAPDADPNWTDDEIAQMILDKLNDRLKRRRESE